VAERRDAMFRLRLWTWVVRKQGRSALPAKPRRRAFRFVVLCRRCGRLVMLPRRLGAPEYERMRLHLTLHPTCYFDTTTTDALLRHFDVKPRRVR